MANKKKIFDIVPPKETQKPVKVLATQEPLVKRLISKKPLISQAGWPIFIVVGLLLVSVFCFVFVQPKATINIWPKKETIQLATQFSSIGEVVQQNQSLSQEFPATGKAIKEEKAQGVIRVYNNYHLDQILVQNTRFWCFADGALREFKTKERVVIPPQKHLDVTVVASSAGEDYNISPCTFSVPGLKGNPRYTAVYGESFSPMTGGKIIEVTEVSQQDLNQATAILKEKALKEGQALLENAASPQDYIIIEQTLKTEITEITPLAEVGQAVDNFTLQVKAETSALVLKKSALQDFAQQHLFNEMPSAKELVNGSLAVGYLSETINFEETEITLDMTISAEIYSAMDEVSIKEELRNKQVDEINAILRSFPEIDRSQIRLWPFWVTTAPQDTTRIEVNLIVD